MSDYERPMNEEHENLLRTVLKLEECADLPEHIIKGYWDYTRTATRLGLRVDVRDLLHIVLFANRPTPEKPVTFIDIIEDDGVKLDDIVLAKFRNKWRFGRYKGYDASYKKVLVVLDEDSEQREFNPLGVRLPIKEELESVGI